MPILIAYNANKVPFANPEIEVPKGFNDRDVLDALIGAGYVRRASNPLMAGEGLDSDGFQAIVDGTGTRGGRPRVLCYVRDE